MQASKLFCCLSAPFFSECGGSRFKSFHVSEPFERRKVGQNLPLSGHTDESTTGVPKARGSEYASLDYGSLS